jgi:methylenetetrahydrofolate dehydrogenase (NADP+)/methenyltetrahydrofolate cyclohydrolase
MAVYHLRAMADRFDKFTERARRVLTLAQEEALSFNHDYIGTEHLLLGLVREEEGIAARTLGNLGVELNEVRSAVEFIVGRGQHAVMGEIALTPHAKKAIELTVDEARRLGHHFIATEHVLLGLVSEGEGIAAGILVSSGISPETLRHEVERLLSGGEDIPAESRPHLRFTSEPGTKQRLVLAPSGAGYREPAVIIDGKAIAAEVREEAKQRADKLHEWGITPGLALVLVGENPSSLSYVRSKGDAAEQAGIYSDMFQFAENTEQQTLLSRILDLNDDGRFHGILVQLPLPKQLDEHAIINSIDPSKDADGVTPTSLGRLLRGEPGPWPATPAGIVELLHRSGHPPAGKHVVVCGRSNIVGKPVAAILMQKSPRANATVTLCHTGTPDLASFTRQGDILIAAMGAPNAITAEMVKPGAVVIDVGNNWIEDETRQSGRRLVGDVDFESVRQVASTITPVPGGVGPMTVAMLLSNTVMLAEQQAGRH